jgi:hypothetical protein
MNRFHGAGLYCCAVLGCLLASPAFAQTTSLAAILPREVAANERIEAALARPVTLEFVDTPLRDVTDFIAREFDIHVKLTKKIADAGVQLDNPVTGKAQGISLESALNKLLKDLNLTLMVHNETLMITTVEDAQSPENLVIRVYPVADLIRGEDGRSDFDPLIDLITSTVEPDSWQDVGGPGSINGFDSSLVFSQRREIHQRIEALLSTLRRVKQLPGYSNPIAPATAGNAPLSRSLQYTRRTSSSQRMPSQQAPGGGGGLFSVPNAR